MASIRDIRRDALPSGTVLRDYTLEKVLGHGGFGIVYRARHELLGNVVAIKEYLPGAMADRIRDAVQVKSMRFSDDFESGMHRFLSEARALVALQSCSVVVTCLDCFQANRTAYLVMEYVEGMSLEELLKKREALGRPFTEEELLMVAEPLLKGLVEVHRAGMWHRDIKPSNILIRRENELPVLIDFGSVKQLMTEGTRSLAPYTEGYAAPEQWAGESVGPSTDVYGVGAVMWRVVAGGKPPWNPPNPVKGEVRMSAELAGRSDPLPSAIELGAGRFERELLGAIDRCLKLRRDERFQNCDDLLALVRHRGPSAPRFSLDLRPAEARVHFMGGERGYAAGMELEEGTYELEVSSVGYETRRVWVEHGESMEPHRVELDVLPAPPLAARREEELLEYVEDWDKEVGAQEHVKQARARVAELRRAREEAEAAEATRQEQERQAAQVEWGRMGEGPPEARLREFESQWEGVQGTTGLGLQERDRLATRCNSVGMEFARIPAGEFSMGSTSENADPDEQPITKVEISKGFYLGKHLVTQGQWKAVMGINPSKSKECGQDCPVENVSWNDVQRFVSNLNEIEGTARYRLPTEAEWEYAARAETTGDFYAQNLDAIAWYDKNSGGRTHAVGRKEANGFGLHDMLGNVWEWLEDWYGPYSGGSVKDPAGPSEGSDRVIRGGSWYYFARGCRSTFRFSLSPADRSMDVGFRILRAE